MIRKTGLLVVMVFLASLVFSSSAAADTTIRFTAWGGPEQEAFYQTLIAEFEARHPNIRVSYEPEGWAGYHDKRYTEAVAQMAPDVFLLSWAFFLNYARPGILLELTPYVDSDSELDIDDFWPRTLDHATYDGKLFGLPFLAGGNLMYLNIDLFEEAGVALPDDDWTWDDFLDIAKKLTKDTTGDGRIDQFGFGDVGGWSFYSNLIFSHGGQFYNDDQSAFILDSDAARTAFQFIHDLVITHGVAPSPLLEEDMGGLFLAGRQAMSQTIPTLIGTLDRSADFRWTVVPNPRGSVRRVMTGGNLPLVIYSRTRHPEAAWAFAKFATSREMDLFKANIGMTPPVRRSSAPLVEDSRMRVFANAMEDQQPMTNKHHGLIVEIINEQMDLLLAGDKSVETAVRDMNRNLNQMLRDMD